MRALFFALLCFGCNSVPPDPVRMEIEGRTGEMVYRTQLPENWSYKKGNDFASDTTKALIEFHFKNIRVTFHNFPNNPIPPLAQVARWKKQFQKLDTSSVSVKPQAFSGYVGTVFEGTGIIDGEHKTVLAWAMQLAPEHLQYLQDGERGASFTLKAVGPKDEMALERRKIMAFAKSFELIDELPSEL